MTGFDSKQRMAADKFIAAEERKVGERYGYVPKLHPSEWMNDHNEDNLDMVAQPAQQPSITRPCRSCDGAGDRDTGIPESPIATCKPCNGTGQIALAKPAQEPINLLEARKIAAEYKTPDSQIDSGNLYFALSKCLEHIDAQPAQEPVAYVTGTSFGRFIVEPLNFAMVLPVGMALYSSPQGNT
jgi:hypothetical protein